MLNRKIRITFILLLVFALGGGAGASANVAAQHGQQGHQEQQEQQGQQAGKTIVQFDLKTFLAQQLNSKMAYDYLKLATALQGLVNRSQPELFYLYESNGIAKAAGMDTDQFWLDQLRKEGGFMAPYDLVTAANISDLLDRFKDAYNGVVVWDSNIPATANVASTAAGVEGLLPVRYDETPGSPYEELVVNHGLPVVINLVNKFTGQGTIPDTDLASSGSAKNDAYLWAKVRYLDSRRTNPTLMSYALDGVSWTTGEKLNAQIVSTALPKVMKVGQELEIALTVKNTGKSVWTMASNDRLGDQSTNQFIWKNLNGGYSNGVGNQLVFLSADEQVQPGQQKTFSFTIAAPGTAGKYVFSAGMVRDGVSWFGPDITRTIDVTTDVTGQPPTEEPVPQTGDGFQYPDLFNSSLPNADYYIANKAFFFDLSPDVTAKPIDDRSQPLGTDYNTLIELLRSQNSMAGKNIITIGGFVPWWLKYTTYADSQAHLEPVQSEWKFVDIVSGYNAQIDADAFGLIGLSNASVYQHTPLHPKFKQKNDKGQNGKTYDKNKKYVVFYMGDYDSGAWTAGALPALWNDPKRGELPLAWAPDPGLSKRIPQLFNYLNDTMSPNDYFVSGDNGGGYLNPMRLLQENRPDGLPDFLKVWENYNKKLFNRFDLDITGFLISGNSGQVPLRVQQSYSRFSPDGVGNNGGFEQPVVNDTPFGKVKDLGQSVQGEQLASALKGNQKFFNFRTILVKPSDIVNAVNYVKTHYPEINFEVVDPYTYFRFYKEGEGWVSKAPITYDAQKTTTPIHVDGKIQPGEWDGAADIVVSPGSVDVGNYGTVWGAETDARDLTSTYHVKWDDQYLYLLEQRKDDALKFTETGSKMYLSDATLFFLDTDHNRSGSTYGDGDYSIFMTPSGPDGQPHLFMREGHDSGVQEFPFMDGKIAADVQADGYTMEVAIPWSKLQVAPFTPQNGKLMGMTVLSTDNDGTNNWGQIMWVGDGDSQENWADMRLTAN